MKLNPIVFSDEITLWWDKEWDLPDGISYAAVLQGEEKIARSTHVTFDSLVPDTDYEITLFRLLLDGKKEEIANVSLRTKKEKKRIDVTKEPYACASDGETLVTQGIQQALNDCTADACVYFPRGTYLSGALTVPSNVEIYLDEGALLLGSARVEDYLPRIASRFEGIEMECYSSLLNLGTLDSKAGPNCENVVIRGKGEIRGGGLALCNAMIESERERLKEFLAANQAFVKTCENGDTVPGRVRSRLINMSNCDGVIIAGLTLGFAASWNLQFIYSSNIVTYGCHIQSRGVWNGDGWDPDSSTDSTLFGTTFDTHDNSIAVKSGKNPGGNLIGRPTQNIRIFDCSGGQCMALGSEMSGGIEKVYVWDCDFTAGTAGMGVKVTPKRGGYMRDCIIRNCAFTSIRMRSVTFNDDGEPADHMSRVHDLRFKNITLTGNAVQADGSLKPTEPLLVSGLDGEDNYFDRITFDGVRFKKRFDGKEQVVLVKNVKNFRMTDVTYE